METIKDVAEAQQILFTQDGILLKAASADYLFDLNKPGSLSLVKNPITNCLSIEWTGNENILITDYGEKTDDEWAIVDTVDRAAGHKPPACVRLQLENLKAVKIMSNGQTIRLLRKSDGDCHSEYFFQHGNSDAFVKALKYVLAIDSVKKNRQGFTFLYVEEEKVRKSFDELRLVDIKERPVRVNKWLPTNVVDFFVKIPKAITPPCMEREVSPLKEEFQVLRRATSELSNKPVQMSLNIGKVLD